MHLAFRSGRDHFAVDVQRAPEAAFTITINGTAFTVAADPLTPTSIRLTIDGKMHVVHVVRVGAVTHVVFDGVSYTLEADHAAGARSDDGDVRASPLVTAPMPGKVLKVLVSVGQAVAAGDPLLILEAMKMETRIRAEGAATVRRVAVEEGQMVDAGALLVELDPTA